jgi:NAD(P)H-flavin reductase
MATGLILGPFVHIIIHLYNGTNIHPITLGYKVKDEKDIFNLSNLIVTNLKDNDCFGIINPY